MCFTVLTMPHWSSSEQLPVLLRDKKDATLIYKKEICLYISVTSGDQPIFVCSVVLRYTWFYKLELSVFQNKFWICKIETCCNIFSNKDNCGIPAFQTL